MITDNKIIQFALAEYLVKLSKSKDEMIKKHYDKKHDKFCFTEDEINELLEIQKNQTKTYQLIRKYSVDEKTS